jgi:hypothetical protein
VIGEPLNDRACLGAITAHARERAASADVQAIAARFASTAELAAWIRTLPQRDDDGDPLDGPKVACDVPQRLRVPSTEPNCVERAAFFAAAAESIDPSAVYALATIDTENGRHTFPTENGRPVVLDPTKPRNGLAAGLDMIGGGARAVVLPLSFALAWALDIAEEPAAGYVDGGEALADAHATAGALMTGDAIDRQGLAALVWVLALAEREQARWWPQRRGVVRRVVEVLAGRARGLVVDGCGCGPDGAADDAGELRNGWSIEWAPRRYLSAAERAARAVEPIARPLVKPALKAVLASYGVPPQLVDAGDAAISAAGSNRTRPAADTTRTSATTTTTTTRERFEDA